MHRHQTVLLFGPPGSGKGTQGRILGDIPGYYHCACGDVFRRLDPNTELGQTFLSYSSRGELVPDEVTVKIWHAHIKKVEAVGAYKSHSDLLILDGIPRNVEQAKLLDEELEVLRLINLACPDEEAMIERLRRRALKENRADDAKEDVIRHRWDVYRAETQHVLDHYPAEMISEVNAQNSPAEVLRDVLDIVIPIQTAHYRRLAAEGQTA
ncbi:nucleoside monophosphate kinase [Planctomycetales bacterium ZRK34]|nr:nucleoside monophosphate kinase [Planctomycetales bacterium ZRK34]